MNQFLKSLFVKTEMKKFQEIDRRGAFFTELLRENRGEEALQEFLGILNSQPDWPQIHFEIMDYSIKRELMGDRLFPHLCKAIESQPNNPQLRLTMGLLLQCINNQPGAIKEYETAIRLQKDYAAAYHNLAIAYSQTDPLKAIELWENAIKFNPRLAEAHFGLGRVLMRVGEKKEAIESFRRFVPLAYAHLKAFKKQALMEIEAAQKN